MRLIDIEAPVKIELELDGDKCRTTVTASTVDAVPVVRCRDCRHSRKDDVFNTRWCQKPGHGKEVKDGFFCAFGERKDDEHTD